MTCEWNVRGEISVFIGWIFLEDRGFLVSFIKHSRFWAFGILSLGILFFRDFIKMANNFLSRMKNLFRKIANSRTSQKSQKISNRITNWFFKHFLAMKKRYLIYLNFWIVFNWKMRVYKMKIQFRVEIIKTVDLGVNFLERFINFNVKMTCDLIFLNSIFGCFLSFSFWIAGFSLDKNLLRKI